MPSGVQITGLIKPLSGGLFPVFEDINGLGGFRAVADLTARNAIPAIFRKIGMVVTLQTSGLAYELVGGITNNDWVPFGGSGTGQIIVATTADLGSRDASADVDGAVVQVTGFDSYTLNYSPYSSSGGADGVNLILPTNPPSPNALWVRSNIQNANNEYVGGIFVNAQTGDDGARTPGSGTPLKTLQEAMNRISRLLLAGSDITINYANTGSSQSFDADLTGIIPLANTTAVINIVGVLSTAATQTISTYVAPDAVANVRGEVDFPAAGYAAGEALSFNTNSVAWVQRLASANVNNTGHFFAQDASVDDPSGGNDVRHVTLPSKIGNINARVPAGYQIQVLNCTVEHSTVSQGASRSLVFNQCKFPNGAVGSGPIEFVNCYVGGVFPSQTDPNAHAGEWLFRHCTFALHDVNISGSSCIIGGSSTFVARRLNVFGSYLECPVLDALAEIGFFDLSSLDSCLNVTEATVNLDATILFGSNNSINQAVNIQQGGHVYYRSDRFSTVTGGSNWKLGNTRVGTWAQLPATAPKIDASFGLTDPKVGASDASLYLTGRSANIGATNLFSATPTPGLYQITGYIVPVTAGTGGALQLKATWTDDSGSTQTATICTYADISVLVGGAGGVIAVAKAGSSNIQYSVTGITTAGALVYTVRIKSELLSDG